MTGVTNLPSLPKNGELLIVKSIDIVGSSIAIVGNGSGSFTSAIVSPISETIDTDNGANIPGLHGINFRTSQALKYIHFP